MEFKFKLENIVFYIEVKKDPDFKPQKKVLLMEDDRLNNIEKNDFNFYSLFIRSEKENQSLKHYIGGLILTSKEEDISKELEEILEEFDYIDQILKDWELLEEAEGPRWKTDNR